MPGNATINETTGQPQQSADADFGVCIIGYTSASAVGAGQLSPAYSDMQTAVTDLRLGDAVDVLCQAIAVTNANPAPPPVSIYSTPATTPGSYGTIDNSGVTGTCRPANNTSVAPTGTYEPWWKTVTGGTIGTAGITGYASLDGGRTKRLVALGTIDTYNFPASDGWEGGGGQAGFLFNPGSTDLTALNTLINEAFGDFNAHVVLTTGTVHTSADSADVVSSVTYPSATSTATRIARINALKAAYNLHRVKGSGASIHINAGGDTTNVITTPDATDDESALTLALAFKTALNAHDAGTTWHTIADATNTVTSPAPSPGTLLANDTFFTTTVAPQWDAAADLYAAGPPATGAFAEIAKSSQQFGIIVLTEPMAAADFSTVKAGLDYVYSFGKRPSLIARFRDPTSGETDAAYIAAFQTFVAACLDSRIRYLAGSLYVTDSFTGRIYLRTGLAPYLARQQSFKAIAGQEGERLAQNAGWVARGPIEGASLRDSAGNTIGHDESIRGGITAADGAPTGGGVAFCYRSNVQVAGTYVDDGETVAYPVLSTVLTPGDRRVANALESLAVGISLLSIGGANITDPGPPETLDEDIRTGLQSKIAKRILDEYPHEFANPSDPALVVVDSVVTRSGARLTITGTLNVRFFNYTRNVALKFSATR